MANKHWWKLPVVWMFVCISTLLVSGCGRPRLEEFPDTEIIYQTSDHNQYSLGFVNADGSNQNILTLDFQPGRPTWSADGETVYYIDALGDFIFDRGGYVSYWKEGKGLSTCRKSDWWDILQVLPVDPQDPDQVFVLSNNKSLLIVNLKSCREEINLLERRSPATFLYSASISQDMNYLAFSEVSETGSVFTVFILNREDQQEVKIGEGINPSISPDNRWVAYTGFDGIYLARIDGTQQQQIVPYDAAGSLGSSFEIAPPAPNWSPDSKWLIYHQCMVNPPDNCHHAEEFQIFKVELETGTISLVVDGGTYPYWREREPNPQE